MTVEERKALIESAKSLEELEEIRKQLNEDEAEEVKETKNTDVVEGTKEVEISKEEERALLKETSEEVETRKSTEMKKIKMEESKMEEKRFTTASPEYRSAWAKTLMGQELNETEKRALGDAIGTTATDFVASAANAQGINNYGLLIPDSVRLDWLKIAEQASPIYRDIRKLNINGNVDFPYLFGADDAEWYAETTTTKNEGQEFKNIK